MTAGRRLAELEPKARGWVPGENLGLQGAQAAD